MRLTVLGCSDAFGSGGRFNTCFMLDTGKARVIVDCGASSLVAMRVRGVEPSSIDGVILSHLHGDHFGGLPFFLLDAHHLGRRERPLVISGPPGTRARLAQAMEALFPQSSTTKWRFALEIVEIPVGAPTAILGLDVTTTQVVHPSAAPSTAVRIADGARVFAYSGDTEWTDALIGVAAGTDLFVVECYDYVRPVFGHMNWATLEARLPELSARRVMLTHMNPSMLAHVDEAKALAVLVAEDGLVLEI